MRGKSGLPSLQSRLGPRRFRRTLPLRLLVLRCPLWRGRLIGCIVHNGSCEPVQIGGLLRPLGHAQSVASWSGLNWRAESLRAST